MSKLTTVLGLATALTMSATAGALAGPNLIVNGDFSAGLSDFTSGYTVPTNPACQYGVAVYCQGPESTIFVNTDPNLDHPSWTSFGTTGSGNDSPNMLIVNGGSNPLLPVWEQSSIAVMAYETYQFTGWVAANYASNPALISIGFNGVTVSPPFTVSTTPGLWQEITIDWYSGSNATLDLALFDLNPVADGNDFSVTNLSLLQTSVPEPASAAAFMAGLAGLLIARRRRAV